MTFIDRFDAQFPDYGRALSGGSTYDPAMGLALVQNPESIIPHLVAKGAKPPADIPEGVDHIDAGQSLGHALGYNEVRDAQGNVLPSGPGAGTMPSVGQSIMDAITKGWGYNTAPSSGPPSSLITGGAGASGPKSIATGGAISQDRTSTPLSQTPIVRSPSPSSQQGADETPVVKPKPPTPAPENATATGAATEGDTSQQPPEPTPRAETKAGTKRSGLDDLGQALAGVRAMAPPQPQHIFSPQAPRPTNQIARSNAPQVLMQELMAATRPEAMLRLGQALGGK